MPLLLRPMIAALERRQRELQLVIDAGDAHETLTPTLIACPLTPEKFLKQFAALLREHTAVDIAAMI